MGVFVVDYYLMWLRLGLFIVGFVCIVYFVFVCRVCLRVRREVFVLEVSIEYILVIFGVGVYLFGYRYLIGFFYYFY